MDSASALIIHNDKILLFLRDDIPIIPHPNCWHCPGGQMDSGETPDETIKRELSEEVTYVPQLKLLGSRPNSSGTGKAYIYIAFVNDDESKLFKLGPGEGQEIRFFTFDEALKLNLTPGVKNYFEKHQDLIKNIIETKSIPLDS